VLLYYGLNIFSVSQVAMKFETDPSSKYLTNLAFVFRNVWI